MFLLRLHRNEAKVVLLLRRRRKKRGENLEPCFLYVIIILIPKCKLLGVTTPFAQNVLPLYSYRVMNPERGFITTVSSGNIGATLQMITSHVPITNIWPLQSIWCQTKALSNLSVGTELKRNCDRIAYSVRVKIYATSILFNSAPCGQHDFATNWEQMASSLSLIRVVLG